MADTRIAQTIPDGLLKADPKSAGYLQSIENAIKSGSTTAAANAAAITSLDTRVTALENPVNPVTTYVSPDQTITASTVITLAHGLSAQPSSLRALLVCKTAEFTFAVGDIIQYPTAVQAIVNAGVNLFLGCHVKCDATNITISYPAGGTTVFMAYDSQATPVFQWLTNGNWKLRIVAEL